MTTTRMNIPKSLVPGVHAFVGESYGKTPEQHAPLYEIVNSDRAFEEEVHMSGMGGAYEKAEGGAYQYDDIQENWTARYVMETVGLAFKITKEAIDDDLYGNIARIKSQALGKAMADTKQVKAAAVFNNGFDTNYTGGDGKPLFADDHPTIAGTFDNKVAVDLSESALEDAFINISQWVDDRGILMAARPKSLHLPRQLYFVAEKILKSDLSTGIGLHGVSDKSVNDINAVKGVGMFPGGVHVNDRFTDPDAWFIKTDIANGTKMFVREALNMNDDVDFDTDNLKFRFRERYGFGWTDYKQWYGSEGS